MRRKDRQLNDINDIESIISRSDVCRVAFADENTPYLVAMNFGYSGGDHPSLYFHCAPEGRKIDMIRKNNFVCFEIDTDHEIYGGENGCDWGMKFSSVVGFGKISILEERDVRIEGLNCIMKHYAGGREFTYDENTFEMTTILKLSIQEMTGKRK